MKDTKVYATSRTIKKQVVIPVEMVKLADLIKSKRKALGLSQQKVADLLGKETGTIVSYKRIYHWEKYHVKTIDDIELDALCKILEIDKEKDLHEETTITVIERSKPIHLAVIEEFTEFAKTYLIVNSAVLSQDKKYCRAIKTDVRDMLEEYFREKDDAPLGLIK